MSLLLLPPWQLFVWSDWIPCFPLILVPCVQKPLLYIACHICISYILQYIVLRAIFARVRQNAKNAKLQPLLIFLYKSDSIAVSLFTNSIRRQGPNNYTDTVRQGALSTFNRVETLKEAFSEGVKTGLAMKTYQFPSFYIYFFPSGGCINM